MFCPLTHNLTIWLIWSPGGTAFWDCFWQAKIQQCKNRSGKKANLLSRIITDLLERLFGNFDEKSASKLMRNRYLRSIQENGNVVFRFAIIEAIVIDFHFSKQARLFFGGSHQVSRSVSRRLIQLLTHHLLNRWCRKSSVEIKPTL